MYRIASFIFVAAFLGGCASSGGEPTAATASPSSSAAGQTQLGVSGDGGTLSTAGVDVVSPTLGDSGLLGSTLSGGSDGTVGSATSDMSGTAPALPTGSAPVGPGSLDDATAMIAGSAPSLGVSGDGGLGEDLLGYDVVGGLIGTDGALIPVLLGGGDAGAVGSAAPAGDAPAQPLGDALATVIEGAQTNGNSGPVNALSPVVQPILLGDTAGGTSALPTDQVVPALVPVLALVTQLETTPLPGGQTAGDVVIPVIFGAGLGVAGGTLPLDTVASAPVPSLP